MINLTEINLPKEIRDALDKMVLAGKAKIIKKRQFHYCIAFKPGFVIGASWSFNGAIFDLWLELICFTFHVGTKPLTFVLFNDMAAGQELKSAIENSTQLEK